jgi:hypothetical protein
MRSINESFEKPLDLSGEVVRPSEPTAPEWKPFTRPDGSTAKGVEQSSTGELRTNTPTPPLPTAISGPIFKAPARAPIYPCSQPWDFLPDSDSILGE